jgi:hypothetical protein
MINCQGLPQTKWAALDELLALLLSLLSKGIIPANLFDQVYAILKALLSAKYDAGSTGADTRTLVNQYLGSAIAQAQAAVNAGTISSTSTPNVTTFGTGVASGSAASVIAGLSTSSGSFYDSSRTDPSSSYASTVGIIPTQTAASNGSYIGGAAVTGLSITSDEISAYFSGTVSQDDDSFAILLWIGKGKNPMLMLDALAYAKRLHNDVIIPVTSYYKGILYGDKNYKTRLGNILYGIVANQVVTQELRGGPPSRHLLGQAVNFSVTGVESQRVANDLDSGAIAADYGTLALTAGIHVALPFYASNGEVIRHMRLWSDSGVPNFIGYKFT